MHILSTITRRIDKRRAELEAAGEPAGPIALARILWRGMFHIISARWYLRGCSRRGRMVSTIGKPMIRATGTIELDDEVRIISWPVQAKILVDRPGAVLKVGRNSRLNGLHLSVSHSVTIGDNVRIAPYTIIIDNDYHKVDDHFSDEGSRAGIVIEDNVWIAMDARILKGVRIGEGAVVALGALVTRDVPPWSVVAGVPAKVIKTLTPTLS
ncbi:acyltransferase [Prosthecochloris sp. ZM_2]|uniref:acyltransferase n=1 Tax=Prosthecochloris sp. ZM_2 TaxID=2045206 RepID=UPI001314766A|nr:acyltransferase [Prosthecochloris sp. ZM_2]